MKEKVARNLQRFFIISDIHSILVDETYTIVWEREQKKIMRMNKKKHND